MIGSISLLQIVVSVVAAFVGSTVFSIVGFGIGVTGIPILLLVLDPQTAVVMVNTVTIPLLVLVIFQTRRYIHIRRTVPIAIAGLLGMPIGVLFLSSADAGVLRISITVIIIALTLVLALNPNVVRLRRMPLPHITGPAIGFVVSIMLNSLGIGGPLIALFALTQNWHRHSIRGTLALYFLVVEGAGVVGFAFAGLFTMERAVLTGVIAAPVGLGFWLAVLLHRRINEAVFRRLAIVVIILTSLLVLGRELTQL